MPSRIQMARKYLVRKIDAGAMPDDEQIKMKVLQTLGVNVMMYPEGEYKTVNWTLFGNSVCAQDASQARLCFASASNSPRPRIILSRRLTFDLRSPYRKLNKVLVGVA